jgi:hypothetical protein
MEIIINQSIFINKISLVGIPAALMTERDFQVGISIRGILLLRS